MVKGSDLVLCYCKKCGRIILFLFDKDEKICDYCKSEVFPVPEQYLSGEFSIKEELEQQFINEYIKTSPEFDPYLFEQRDKILAKQSADLNAKLEHGKAILEEKNRLPRCPSCGSTNISKIGLVSRIISTQFLGLASSKIGSTHKCKNCGTTW